MLSTAYSYFKHYNPTADVKLFGVEFMGVSWAVGMAEEVAQAFLYLAEAGFVTGQNLPVNGGFVV